MFAQSDTGIVDSFLFKGVDTYRFGFNGKLNDNEVYSAEGSFQDYGMRMYDTRICRFPSVDPMADSRSWMSPYNYCQNNPIGRVDPNGALDDDYSVTKKGNVKLERKTNDNFDVLYTKESWDNGKKDKSIKLDKGVCSNIIEGKGTLNVNKTKTPFNYTAGIINDNKTAIKLFEFLEDNTNVEWSLFKFGAGGNNSNIITTSHDYGAELAGSALVQNPLFFATDFSEHFHGHPGNNWFPSGSTWPVGDPNRGGGDIDFATYLENKFSGKNLIFKIYNIADKKYTPYNSSSFFPLTLPAVEIR
jgi:RHS repeat-associated protein